MQTGRNAPFVEPIAVPDIYASGLGRIECVGNGMVRFTFFVWQESLIDGTMERVVVARLVQPVGSVRQNILSIIPVLETMRGCEDGPEPLH